MILNKSEKPEFLQENPETIRRNQLNVSKAKMQYTFAQSQRFSASIQSASPSKFYDLPDLWNKKGVSMKSSQRVDFSKQKLATPSPGAYEIKSSFAKNPKEGISMGLGRQQVKSKSIFGVSKMKCPNASTYRPQVYYNSRACSLGKKIDRNENKWARLVPGPGSYARLDLTNDRNKKIISKYSSAQASKFSLGERQSLANRSFAPGPGQYDVRSPDFEQSLFDKPYSTKFGYGQRQGLSNKTYTPGPGSYNAFSQFLY